LIFPILPPPASCLDQWFGIPELTAQMKSALPPKALMERAFAVSGRK